jgi:hypothetical protein
VPDAVYTFKHALVQDAVHGSLRQQLHAQIAANSRPIPPSLWTASPSSQHYAEAGLAENLSSTGVGPVGGPPPAR